MILLDTNVVIHSLKGREPVASRFRAASPAEISIPSVVAYELEYGSLRTTDPRRRSVLMSMLSHLREVPFDRDAARESAKVRLDLERRGQTIGPMDILIAGTALSRGATLVTNNTAEFSRIAGLRLRDWTA